MDIFNFFDWIGGYVRKIKNPDIGFIIFDILWIRSNISSDFYVKTEYETSSNAGNNEVTFVYM